jgi:hypothetical protein
MNKREEQIAEVCNKIKSLLLLKNKAYGDSALSPVRVFSKNDPIDGLLVRIDDKLSRIKNVGITSATEDTLMDLIGYLVLLKVQLNEKDEAYHKAWDSSSTNQLGTDHDIDRLRYYNGTATGY